MNLDKLIKMQRNLDNKIREEKGLQGADLVANTYVALQVELAEFANEARWFKHWSNDQEPRNKDIECHACKGKGEFISDIDHFELIKEKCGYCDGTGIQEKNPLLEEYIDGVHFFLSIAIQKGWEDSLYLHEGAILDLQAEGFRGGLTGVYLEMLYFLNKSFMENKRSEKIEKVLKKTLQEFNFSNAWFLFIAIGLIGFEFTGEQIERAYLDKNKINHERQANGY